MKKIAAEVLALALLMTFAAVLAPAVMAATSKKIAVTRVTAISSWTLGLDFWTTEGGVYHSRNSVVTGNFYEIKGGGIDLVGSNMGIVDQNLNILGTMTIEPVPGIHISVQYGKGNSCFDSTVTLTDAEGHSGTFEGILHYQGSFIISPIPAYFGYLYPWNADAHGVWHGTGDFQGWTYQVDEEYVMGVSQGTVAYLMIP